MNLGGLSQSVAKAAEDAIGGVRLVGRPCPGSWKVAQTLLADGPLGHYLLRGVGRKARIYGVDKWLRMDFTPP